jgi:GGDEF domain-containing protein
MGSLTENVRLGSKGDFGGDFGHPVEQNEVMPAADKFLTKLIEQAVLDVSDLDVKANKKLRDNVGRLAPLLPALPLNASDLALMQQILEEFGRYHQSAEIAVRDQISGWRALVSKLLDMLLSEVGVKANSTDAAPLMKGVATLLTGEELHGFMILMTEFFRLKCAHGKADKTGGQQHITLAASNDNVTGLHGDGAAVEYVKDILDTGGKGFVVFFHLSSLCSIKERYGVEVMQDCMMAISAFLTRNLRSEDTIYYWNESYLLAVLPSPAAEKTMAAVIQNIVDKNRDITVRLGGRVVMLRVPMSYELTPISRLHTAADLYNLPAKQDCNCKR